MYIANARVVTDELIEAVARLMPHLKLKYALPSRTEIEALVDSNSSNLIIARYPDENGAIAGMLTLIVYRVPSGVRAHVEDLVVETSMRDRGIGEALVRTALDVARENGANGVALTTNPRREAANRLYQRLGFKLWRTNLYFYEF